MNDGDPLIRLCVLVDSVYFDRRRLEKDYGFLTAAAALLALAAPPPVLAHAAAAALLAPAALPPVLAEAAAAALLALAAPPPVLAEAAAAALLADVALPPVRTGRHHARRARGVPIVISIGARGVKTRNSLSRPTLAPGRRVFAICDQTILKGIAPVYDK